MALVIVFGVITPLILLATDAYLLLGWRYQSRIRRGLCPKCKYDLRGEDSGPDAKCPECGWQRP